MVIHLATATDLSWVNAQYQAIDFVPSHLDNEIIAIVMHNESYAGVGRIVYLNDHDVEIGGIYILEQFRGLSLAHQLVDYLVETVRNKALKNVYCLPFAELRNFYTKFGFKEVCAQDQTINAKILKKHQWCLQNYDKSVLLLKLAE